MVLDNAGRPGAAQVCAGFESAGRRPVFTASTRLRVIPAGRYC